MPFTFFEISALVAETFMFEKSVKYANEWTVDVINFPTQFTIKFINSTLINV